MELLDFLTCLPAEEKDIFLNLLEETGSIEVAVKGTMIILAESEPKLARKMEKPVREWLKIDKSILPKDEPVRPALKSRASKPANAL